MRQEKTMKVLTNHFLDPRIQLVPNAGSDKSWVWNCFDFAENELLETVRICCIYVCVVSQQFYDLFIFTNNYCFCLLKVYVSYLMFFFY